MELRQHATMSSTCGQLQVVKTGALCLFFPFLFSVIDILGQLEVVLILSNCLKQQWFLLYFGFFSYN
jgi:hypothetical protein